MTCGRLSRIRWISVPASGTDQRGARRSGECRDVRKEDVRHVLRPLRPEQLVDPLPRGLLLRRPPRDPQDTRRREPEVEGGRREEDERLRDRLDDDGIRRRRARDQQAHVQSGDREAHQPEPPPGERGVTSAGPPEPDRGDDRESGPVEKEETEVEREPGRPLGVDVGEIRRECERRREHDRERGETDGVEPRPPPVERGREAQHQEGERQEHGQGRLRHPDGHALVGEDGPKHQDQRERRERGRQPAIGRAPP